MDGYRRSRVAPVALVESALVTFVRQKPIRKQQSSRIVKNREKGKVFYFSTQLFFKYLMIVRVAHRVA
jgi:hypothetical protein